MVFLERRRRHPRRDVVRQGELMPPAVQPLEDDVSIEVSMEERIPERLETIDARLSANGRAVVRYRPGGIGHHPKIPTDLLEQT